MSDHTLDEKAGGDAPVDSSRRHFLTLATAVVGGVGVAFAATPFVSYFRPSERAKVLGAPVRVDLSKLEEGAILRVEWRGQPVFVVRRTPESLDNMRQGEGLLRDPASEESVQPDFAKNDGRALRDDIFVVKGVCTHLGCAPSYLPSVSAAEVQGEWYGGFFCPCHGSKFDIAGRVYAGVPAQRNLDVPPYQFLSDTELVVGEAGAAA